MLDTYETHGDIMEIMTKCVLPLWTGKQLDVTLFDNILVTEDCPTTYRWYIVGNDQAECVQISLKFISEMLKY